MQRILKLLNSRSDVIWDWNGTLLDDVDLCYDLLCEALKKQNLAPVTQEQYRSEFFFPVKEYYKKVGFNFDLTPFEELSNSFISKYKERVLDCKLYPGVREILEEVKSRGLSNSILSAAHDEYLRIHLDHYNLTHFFDHIYALSDHYADGKIGRGKQLMSKLAITPSAAIMIGDTDHDAEVAKELGIDIVLYADGHQTYERLKGAHNLVYESKL